MAKANKLIRSMADLNSIEQMATGSSPLHNLSASIKILMTLCFILCVVSIDRYALNQVLAFAFYPIIALCISNLRAKILLKKALFSLAFVLFIALANLFTESTLCSAFLGFSSLMLKAFLCILAVLILSASTKMNDIAQALRKFHIPCIIVLQLMLSFRYIEVLIKQAINIKNAYLLRSNRENIPLRDWVKLVGSLILKSIDSANSLYKSMLCRGFNAHFVIKDNSTITFKEYLILTAFCLICISLRVINFNFTF